MEKPESVELYNIPETQYPLVSILMPVFNGAQHIRESVASLVKQTYRNIELVIVDDGSTDDTLEIINQIKDPRIRIVSLPKNMGIVGALNTGFDLCKGEFIARMDCDDICEPDRLSKQYNYLLEHPEVGICGTFQTIFGGYRDGINKTSITHENIVVDLLFRPTMLHPTIMMRTNILHVLAKQLNGKLYDPTYVLCEDYELWVRAANITRLANIPEPFCKYRWEEKKNWEENGEILHEGLKRIWALQLSNLKIPANRFSLYSHDLLSGRSNANLISFPIVCIYCVLLFCNNLVLKTYDRAIFSKEISKKLISFFYRIMASSVAGRFIKNLIKRQK